MRSMRTRMLVGIMALLLPLVAAAAWLLVQAFANALLRDIDVALDEEADTIAALLAGSYSKHQMRALLEHVASETDLGTPKYVAVSERGQLVEEWPAGAQARLQGGDEALRIVRYNVPGAEPPMTIALGVPAIAARAATQRLTSLIYIGVPLLLFAVGGGVWAVTGRALRPLTSAAQQLDRIALDNLSARIETPPADDEVGRLVVVVNKMLERLERAVARLRQFTADAAHELRTPLTVLRTGLDVAVSQQRNAAAYRAALEDALASTDRVSRLAEDLLTLARLDARERPLGDTEVDLGELLQELADAWSEPAQQRGVSVHAARAPDLTVSGNAGDLYRLFNNLIENAVRATPNGGVIALDAQGAETAITASVSDTGPGIAAADLERVFDRFHRGRDASADGGTGLGLSIAREIVRLHGGHLTLANRAGGGCTASVTLRRAARRTAEGMRS